MQGSRRFLVLFAAAIVGASFVHALGHAVAGWLQGVAVVPTPFKEYVLRDEIVWREVAWIALGGVGGGHWLGGRKAPPMAWPTFKSTTPPMSSASISRSRRS